MQTNTNMSEQNPNQPHNSPDRDPNHPRGTNNNNSWSPSSLSQQDHRYIAVPTPWQTMAGMHQGAPPRPLIPSPPPQSYSSTQAIPFYQPDVGLGHTHPPAPDFLTQPSVDSSVSTSVFVSPRPVQHTNMLDRRTTDLERLMDDMHRRMTNLTTHHQQLTAHHTQLSHRMDTVTNTLHSNHTEMMLMVRNALMRPTHNPDTSISITSVNVPTTQDPNEVQRHLPTTNLLNLPTSSQSTAGSTGTSTTTNANLVPQPTPAPATQNQYKEKLTFPNLTKDITKDSSKFEAWYQECLQYLFLHSQMESTITIGTNNLLTLNTSNIPQQQIRLFTALNKALPTSITPNNLIDMETSPNNGFELMAALKRLYGKDTIEPYSAVDKQSKYFNITRQANESLEDFFLRYKLAKSEARHPITDQKQMTIHYLTATKEKATKQTLMLINKGEGSMRLVD